MRVGGMVYWINTTLLNWIQDFDAENGGRCLRNHYNDASTC